MSAAPFVGMVPSPIAPGARVRCVDPDHRHAGRAGTVLSIASPGISALLVDAPRRYAEVEWDGPPGASCRVRSPMVPFDALEVER